MEDVDVFLKSLGLDNKLVDDQPNARDELKEFILFKMKWRNLKTRIRFQHFVLNLLIWKKMFIAKGQAFALFPNALIKLDFNFDGLAEAMECLCREAEKLKKQTDMI
ncbi:unnamed protein product (macronuclear) [Paramecium tetraurelia]|uniref:Uncharacterized protein n=1 Tax=Paramecium tetraurelia TaxID=5888 RepID=A0EEX0_PARTE|nr:uncharacterized protein GSPATT00026184001 [Paramecium tetraurelia]CAK93861.1 unnamed protein product [Paramecium tetraurelia]|eukprot:XP_001461234.1 hypothetical protein (macronuclear) [Paramecium tetraurelia strain d4-2]